MTTYKEHAGSTRSREGSSGSGGDPLDESRSAMSELSAGMRDMAESLRDIANDFAGQLPTVAATTRDVIGDTTQAMETSSSGALLAGMTLTLGLAIGLLIGGSSRILVALALVPATAMAATLLDRQPRAGNGRLREAK